MPRTGITYDDVADAVHALEKAGLTPSIRLIREKLGKGSLSTIADHKRAFDAERATGPGPALPDPIAKHLIAGAQAYWQELVEAAETEITAARESADAEINRLRGELEHVAREMTDLKEALGAKESAIGTLEHDANTQATAFAQLASASRAKDVEIARLETERTALEAQLSASRQERQSLQMALTESQAERASLNERLARQAAEFAKEKATLQAHSNEYKDRLVSLSDDNRQATKARRGAEKVAAAAEQKRSALERENQRLNRDLVDARDEARLLTETLGELRGEFDAERKAHATRLAERDGRLAELQTSLRAAQALVRQYGDTDRRLVQELIDERKAASS